MTEVLNVYVKALDARIIEAIRKNSSSTNITKLDNMRKKCANDAFATLLASSNVDADRLSRAIYASEKVTKFAYIAIDSTADKLNENTYAIFRTAINCKRENVALTRSMIDASISRSVSVTDDVKHVVYQRNATQDEKTIAAQSQTSLDALKTLNIISESKTLKNVFDVNLTDLSIALCNKFAIEFEKEEIEEIDA